MTPEDVANQALRLKADGIAYTYNEPSIFIEFEIGRASCRERVYVLV